jgi:hypothetical protein
VVAQPVALAIVHVEPVKPLIHIHAQALTLRTELPPFWQAVSGSDWHCWRTESAVVVDFGLWMTRSSSGTTTAAAMIMRSIKRTIRNPQHGRPQQRRFFLGWDDLGSKPAEESYV